MSEYSTHILMARTYIHEYRNRIKSEYPHNRNFANWLFNNACKRNRMALNALKQLHEPLPSNNQQSLF